MANEQNLIPNSARSPNEIRENGRKGGINSGRARREKRTLKQLIEIVMSKKQTNSKGETETNKMIMVINLCQKALKGDLKAVELVTKLSGEFEPQKVEVTGKNGKDLFDKIEVEIIDKREQVCNNNENSN